MPVECFFVTFERYAGAEAALFYRPDFDRLPIQRAFALLGWQQYGDPLSCPDGRLEQRFRAPASEDDAHLERLITIATNTLYSHGVKSVGRHVLSDRFTTS